MRLFLSVDVANSTAFKERHRDTSWIKHFQDFYSNFGDLFASNYTKFCTERAKECESFAGELPKQWKTVGDEVLFANRVKSHFQIFAYVIAFKITLSEYAQMLKTQVATEDLDLKGNGWIAQFPVPNQTVAVRKGQHNASDSPLVDEPLEEAADAVPSSFEFLGKGMDSGFRIGANARPDFFTISPMLAKSLCKPHVNKAYKDYQVPLVFEGVGKLKGVNRSEDYPVIGVITERLTTKGSLREAQRRLMGVTSTDYELLDSYLEDFIKVYAVEAPALPDKPTDGHVEPPDFYTSVYSPQWRSESDIEEVKQQAFEVSMVESGEKGRMIQAEELAEIVKLASSRPFEED